jgi:ribosomal protein L18
MIKLTNNASATLGAALTSSATTATLTSGNGAIFPSIGAGEFFYATLIDTSNNLEVVKVTARSGDVLTIVRGQDGTTARAYSVGHKVELRMVAAVFQEMIQRDGSVPMTGNLPLGGNRVTGVADPSSAQDAATKNYVDTTAIAAVNTEAATRAAQDALLLPKAGGTMTGTLAGTTFKSSRTSENARDTGFQLSSGTDIGECDRSTQYYDDRASNCNGYLANGNCSGNPLYTPPNGNWWEWYSGRASQGAWANNGSYDGAGGTTYSYNPVSVGFNYDGYYEAANEIGGSEQRRNYRNCNCGAFNCRTNCNCNCDCNCTCK